MIATKAKKLKSFKGMKLHEILIIVMPLVIFTLLCIIPFIIMLSGSLTDNEIIRTKGIGLFPRGFTLAAYEFLFNFPDMNLFKSYAITIGVTVIGTILNIVLCLLLAFPLSDTEFKYRRIVSFLLFFTMLFSAGLVPTYIFVRRVYMLYDTYAILIILPLCAPGHVFFLRVFLQRVPKSLFESARIDGANEYVILYKVAVPLIMPGIATILFHFVLMYWNDPMTALFYTDNITPIALYIRRWQNYIEFIKLIQQGMIPGMVITTDVKIPDLTVRLAMAILSTAPMLIIFSFFQKHFVGGLTTGAVKG